MSKLRTDQLTPLDDSVVINVADLANLNGIVVSPYSGFNVRQDIIDREVALTSNTNLRVITWNIAMGFQITGWEPNRDFASLLIKERMRQWTLQLGGDIVGLQECWSTPASTFSQFAYYPYVDTNDLVTTTDANSRRFGTGVISTRPLTAKTSGVFTGTGSPVDPTDIRGYTRSVVTVGANPVAFYNVHMSLDPVKRATDIGQLFTLVNADSTPRIVITGDWNTQTDSDFNAFTGAGFGVINTFGEFNSNNHGSTWYIDRILHKGFSSVASKGTMAVPYELSDHRPVYADFVL